MNYRICNQEVDLKFKNPLHSGDIEILPASVKGFFNCSGSECFNVISISIINATDGIITNGVGVGIIKGNSKNVKSNNLPIVLENAESEVIIITGLLPNGATGTYTTNVIIDNSGQEKARGF